MTNYTPKKDWKTSKGNVAADGHLAEADWSAHEKKQRKELTEKLFPNVKVVGDASKAFNCHAYAHAKSHAWFDDPQPFINDDYKPVGSGKVQVNDAVIYSKDSAIQHSGVVVAVSAGKISKVRSKWGQEPEVEHAPGDVPPEYGSISHYLRPNSAFVSSTANSEEALADPITKLISELTTSPQLDRLTFASTGDVAVSMIRQIPQMLDLYVYGKEAEQPLLGALTKASGFAELAIIYALGMLGTPVAIKPLLDRLQSLEEDVVDPIREAVLVEAIFLKIDRQALRQLATRAAQIRSLE